ncbi:MULTISPECIES: hypothetical protein [Bacillus]|uniref:hypothetical protein n=1 Tax=Bacillus TaxID=1386 RepID=UPI00041ACE1A|nr:MULTISPECIES: hypothetical protein [Bacillus]QHZ46893.1 hypothetical protein M654_011555 [Bacillus sp. NSP9.1]WFA07024.1 hypothetical protein P3X63_09735 [Bacillus sp. HSf4]
MKMIKDERLQIQNLKNIRIAFMVQTVGILAILLYEVITKGIMEAKDNPLWLLFILTSVVLGWLNLKISVDVYDDAKEQKKPGPYYRVVILSALIGIILALLAKFGPDHSDNSEALLVGSVVFVCFLIPFSFVHYMMKKRSEENDI